jgi:Flp pilus assembly protein TadD
MNSNRDRFDQACRQHHAGRLADAERICVDLVHADLRDAAAWNLLGVVAYQSGHHTAAIERLRRAVDLVPASAACRSNLGQTLQAQGDLAGGLAECEWRRLNAGRSAWPTFRETAVPDGPWTSRRVLVPGAACGRI